MSEITLQHFKFRSSVAVFSTLICLMGIDQAAAQSFPNRPVTMIVPFAAGTGIDIVTRILGQKMSEDVGQPVIIKNMPGASGNIGADAAAASTPDGYTLGIVANSLFINQYTQKNHRDPINDYAPVSPLGALPYLVAVPLSFPAKSIRDVVALAKAKPGEINFTGLPGSLSHFMGVMLKSAGNIDIQMVSYKSTTDAIPDVLSGRVPLWLTPMPSGLPFVTSGKMRGLAVSGDRRTPLAPDLPTLKEAGFPGMDISAVLYIVAPRGTPVAVINKLNADIGRAQNSKDVQDKFLAQGLVVEKGSPSDLLESMRVEQAKWAVIIKESGMKPE